MLRVQGIFYSEAVLPNQKERHLIEFGVSEISAESRQAEVRMLGLLFDKTQLALLLQYLISLDLPPISEVPPQPAVQ